MLVFIAAAIVLLAAYFIQRKVFAGHAFDKLEFHERLDRTEAVVGDDVYLYEELINGKGMPLPYLKATSKLPEGLAFRLTVIKDGAAKDSFTDSVDSMFAVKGRQRITRRWRITCLKRGVYSLGGALVVSNDLIGFEPVSRQIDPPAGKGASVTVLPAPVDLERDFTSSRFYSGNVSAEKSLITDPLIRAGVRDYTTSDPMNRINWKSSAAHDRLLVNIEEKVRKLQSNVILNMCSHIIEQDDEIPANSEFIEYGITVAASLVERFAAENVPVRLILNTPPETIPDGMPAGEDDVGRRILVTREFTGKNGVLDAMRVLAEVQMRFSMPVERMLDYILEYPESFAENGNIVLVTSVLDGRMIVFYKEMKKRGVDVIFYVTTSNRGVGEEDIPPEAKVFYRTYFDSYHAGDRA